MSFLSESELKKKNFLDVEILDGNQPFPHLDCFILLHTNLVV